MTTLALSWSNLAKAFGRQVLFRGFDGELQQGATSVVVGQNGAGKSTFLRIAAGLMAPDSGEIRRPSLSEIGYASPSVELYEELTGLENLEFFGALPGVSNSICTELLDRVGLKKSAAKRYGSYSSGMRQRLKLAHALLKSPQLLILDEPTIALDSDGIAIVNEIVRTHTKNGGCTLIATNDPAEVNRWADSVLSLPR